ncbi:MAG: dihydrofolate reductase [Brevinematia bacterium]
MEIILIGAVDRKFHIGLDDSIPWDIPLDRRIFRHFTLNHSVIMGRKTFEAIKKPLDRRKNIVLTRDDNLVVEGVFVAHSLNEALRLAEGERVFVIGGEEIYRLFLPIADKIYLTYIDSEFQGNKFFPHFSSCEWEILYKNSFSSRGFSLYFIIYSRLKVGKNFFSIHGEAK